ncbi:MAG: hypothetical protein K2J04_14520, partial [Lachnospiraceae bacterium]|nr:hypothetical protein [Lachnospiraceae bacterium]
MKNKLFYIKKCLFICGIVCVVLDFIFLYQIITQKNKLLEYYQSTTRKNELSESEMTATIESLTEENAALSEREEKITSEVQEFLLRSQELEEEMSEAESWYEASEIVYHIRQYIDSLSAQIYAENGSSEYIDRYFRVEKGELQAIVNDYDIGEEIEAFPITLSESEILLPIGEKVWLRYEEGNGNNLPLGLFIQNPTVDIGYGDARAGMHMWDIKGSIMPELKCVSLDWGDIYYLQYEDDSYRYYYLSVGDRDNPAILYMEPQIHSIKTEQTDVPFQTEIEAEPEAEQKDEWYDEETDNEIKTELNEQLKKRENELDEIEEKTQYLQLYYRLLTLLENTSNKLKDENPVLVYEKYFRLNEGELARICEINDIEECGKIGYLDSHFGGPVISINQNLYVQYGNISDIYE